MMNIPPDQAANLSLWEYEALLHNWNEAHGGGDDIQPPDHELTQRLIDKINLNPDLKRQGQPTDRFAAPIK